MRVGKAPVRAQQNALSTLKLVSIERSLKVKYNFNIIRSCPKRVTIFIWLVGFSYNRFHWITHDSSSMAISRWSVWQKHLVAALWFGVGNNDDVFSGGLGDSCRIID